MKRIIVFICFVFYLVTLYAGKPISKNKIKYSCSYTRKDDFSDNNFWLTNCCSIAGGNIVKTPESAVMLAYVYAQNLYGEDIAKMEQPYNVRLVNDSIWCISGSSKVARKNGWKGSFTMAINKNTGALLAYMHEK